MIFSISRIFLLVLLISPFSSHGKIKHISLHELESGQQQPLLAKLNIVEQDSKPLKITLLNQNIERPLLIERLNDYMLSVKSTHAVEGDAMLKVYELDNELWQQIKVIAISRSTRVTANGVTKVNKALKPADDFRAKTDKAVLTAKVTKKVAPMKVVNRDEKCLLTRQAKETLWSIASRYKASWHTDVYTAMIAIYNNNLEKFTKQHIGRLIDGADLSCPTQATISTLGSKSAMAAEFNRLNNLAKN